MGAKHEEIAAFHDTIVSLRAGGMTWRAIAEALAKQGLVVDHNAVVRYAKKVGLPTEAPAVVVVPPGATRQLQPVAQRRVLSDQRAARVVLGQDDRHSTVASDHGSAHGRGSPQAVTDSRSSEDVPIEHAWLPKPAPHAAKSEKLSSPDAAPRASDTRELRKVAGSTPRPPLFTPMWRAPVWDMSEPLLHFGGEENAWTLQDACEGTLILGATGSGKTSGSGALVSKAFLSGCFGGIVLTAKEDEAVHWQRAAEQLGRSEQICLVQPGGPFKFNFLDYQTKLPESQGGSVENTVELFHAILESYSRNKRKADSFWANTSKQLLRNLVRIIRGARVNFDLMVIRAFLSEVPPDATVAATGAWKTSPTFGRLIGNARVRSRGTPDERFVDEAVRYWTVDLPNLADKTRSIVVMDLVSMLDLFFDPLVWDLFCGETTITPEAVFDGAILVIDLPIKKYLSIGRIAQIIWKHLFQLAVERRSDPNDSTRRPVFLWADEAQNFWSDSDGLFQATARSSRCATVYLTQNIPAFYAQVGGELANERVDGFLANLCTKVFHNNNDPVTNHWAAEQLGKSMQYRASISSGEEPSPASFLSKGIGGFFEMLSVHRSSRVSTNPVVDFEVQPSAFAKLRTGSAKHGGLVDAYIVKSGSSFGETGKHYLKAIFQQEQAT